MHEVRCAGRRIAPLHQRVAEQRLIDALNRTQRNAWVPWVMFFAGLMLGFARIDVIGG